MSDGFHHLRTMNQIYGTTDEELDHIYETVITMATVHMSGMFSSLSV